MFKEMETLHNSNKPNKTLGWSIYNRLEKEIINNITICAEKPETYIFGHVAMAVVVINVSMVTDGHLPINTSKLLNDTKAPHIWIPVEPFKNVSEADRKLGVVVYDFDEQFTCEQRNPIIISKVVRIEVPRRHIVNLTERLIIQFPVNKKTKNVSSCQFYDENSAENTWKNDGCITKQISDNVVNCSCDHMTPFALLMIDIKNIDEQQWEIMSCISYIGCSLSAVFSAFSILSYIVNSNARKEVSRRIHVSLSAALFLLNISFMLSEWAATLNINEVCVFIAVTIHYSLLCCFTWMAIEALHLYLLLVRVFNIHIKHYMAKLSLIGWGVPALLVGCLLSIQSTRSVYGTQKVTLTDTNKTNAVCWTTDAVIPYAVNISYFILVFLFNSIILILVSRLIFRLRKSDNGPKSKTACKNAGTVLGLMCLLGTTWGLAFFTMGYTNYPILYLFCIFNSAQGFYIFLWMCLKGRTKKQQENIRTAISDIHKQN
ncbi:adhesion G-protein coupled receptor G2-like [Paramisgurnus dabryanus]|uniref:adhesion G-protein coupled receptor G2-like n=1 Tax=Paramisgurnus dabryanus TaxID=90735 RepID=UPI0031F3C517